MNTMDGPQHYRRAEDLLRNALDWERLKKPQESQRLIAAAQVHATLANTAAIAELNSAAGPEGGATMARSVDQGQAWAAELVPERDPDEDGEW